MSFKFGHNLQNRFPHLPNIRLHQVFRSMWVLLNLYFRCTRIKLIFSYARTTLESRCRWQVRSLRSALYFDTIYRRDVHTHMTCVYTNFRKTVCAINLSIQYKQLFYNYFLFETCQKLSVDDVQMGSQIAPMSFKFGHNLQNTFPHPPNIRLHQVSGACACY